MPLVERDVQVNALLELSKAMALEGRTLIERVLPKPPEPYIQYEHYPSGDAVDPDSDARWFYHAHEPEARGENEHGHFHIFLPLDAFGDEAPIARPESDDPAEVVHVAALCFNTDGVPTHWIATNQWVTEEFLFPATSIIPKLDKLTLHKAGEEEGIAHIGEWLTLAIAISREDICTLLHERDAALAKTDVRDMDAEVLAQVPFTI